MNSIFDGVVIDAGHGGVDSGARGENALEKDYSLTPSSNLTYKEYFTRYYHNNSGSLGHLLKSELISKKLLNKKRKNS